MGTPPNQMETYVSALLVSISNDIDLLYQRLGWLTSKVGNATPTEMQTAKGISAEYADAIIGMKAAAESIRTVVGKAVVAGQVGNGQTSEQVSL